MIMAPNVNCKHYKKGACMKLPKICFGLIRQQCVVLNDTACDIREPYPEPTSPPPAPRPSWGKELVCL